MCCIAVLLCTVAGHISGLVGGRILGGVGAGGMLAMSPILTHDLVDISVRGAYQGFINIAVVILSAAGAAVGGWITYTFGWRWAFGMPQLLFWQSRSRRHCHT
jgi:MFS family permease